MGNSRWRVDCVFGCRRGLFLWITAAFAGNLNITCWRYMNVGREDGDCKILMMRAGLAKDFD